MKDFDRHVSEAHTFYLEDILCTPLPTITSYKGGRKPLITGPERLSLPTHYRQPRHSTMKGTFMCRFQTLIA